MLGACDDKYSYSRIFFLSLRKKIDRIYQIETFQRQEILTVPVTNELKKFLTQATMRLSNTQKTSLRRKSKKNEAEFSSWARSNNQITDGLNGQYKSLLKQPNAVLKKRT